MSVKSAKSTGSVERKGTDRRGKHNTILVYYLHKHSSQAMHYRSKRKEKRKGGYIIIIIMTNALEPNISRNKTFLIRHKVSGWNEMFEGMTCEVSTSNALD